MLQVKANKLFKITTHDSKLAIMAVSTVQCIFAQYSLIFQTGQCKKQKSTRVDNFIQENYLLHIWSVKEKHLAKAVVSPPVLKTDHLRVNFFMKDRYVHSKKKRPCYTEKSSSVQGITWYPVN